MTRPALLTGLVAGVAALVAAGVAGWLWLRPTAPADRPVPPRPVVTGHAQPATAATGTFVGTVEATTTVGAAFEVLGRLVTRPANEGDVVAKGDLLATIDASALRDDRDAARAAVDSAEASLATAQKALERTRELVQRGADSTTTLEAAQRNEAVAQANAEQARAQLARAEDALQKATLLAPMDGIVIQIRHDPGTTVAAGDPVLVLASPSGRKVTLTLPATVLTELAPGAPFAIRAPDLPSGGIAGTLLRIDPVSVSETRMRAAEIALGPEAEHLAIGQLVEVSPAPGPDGVAMVTVPAVALFTDGNETRLWEVVADGDGTRRVHARTVTPGASAGDSIALPASEIGPGAEIVLRGVNSLREGQPVGAAVVSGSGATAAHVIVGEGEE